MFDEQQLGYMHTARTNDNDHANDYGTDTSSSEKSKNDNPGV